MIPGVSVGSATLPKTFVQSSNGGLSTAEGITYPSNLFYKSTGSPMGPVGRPHMNYHNSNAFRQSTPTTTHIIANNLSDEAQLRYAQGHPLWVFRPEDSDSNLKHTLYSLYNINFWLETIHRNNIEVEIDTFYDSLKNGENGVVPKGMKRRSDALSRHDAIPLTLDEIFSTFKFLGYCHTVMAPAGVNVKTRSLNFASRYEVVVPNIWGQVRKGDTLYFKGTIVNGFYNAYYDLDGNVLGPATQVSFPQIVPYFERDVRKFIHCTQFMDPLARDLDCYETCLRKQKVYHTDPLTGLIDYTKAPMEKLEPLVYPKYTVPPIWKLGTVTNTVGDASLYDTKMPLRSSGHYDTQRAKCNVTINMETINDDLEFISTGEISTR